MGFGQSRRRTFGRVSTWRLSGDLGDRDPVDESPRGDYRETWETETLWTSLHVETIGRIRGGLRALLRAAIDGAGGYAELAKAAGVDEPDLL